MFKIKKVTLNEINIVTFLLMISPIIDNINGFLLLNGIEAGISSLYKSLLLFIFLIALLFAKHKYLKKTVLAICVLAFLLIASFLYPMFRGFPLILILQ